MPTAEYRFAVHSYSDTSLAAVLGSVRCGQPSALSVPRRRVPNPPLRQSYLLSAACTLDSGPTADPRCVTPVTHNRSGCRFSSSSFCFHLHTPGPYIHTHARLHTRSMLPLALLRGGQGHPVVRSLPFLSRFVRSESIQTMPPLPRRAFSALVVLTVLIIPEKPNCTRCS